MNKTIQINIAGVVFNIDENAYPLLHNYLESINKYFSTYEGHQEITDDIEGRIAEKFSKQTTGNGIVNVDDVNQIIKSMGTVSDFEAIKLDDEQINSSESSPEAKSTTSYTNKSQTKFFRDVNHKALGGVLAGLAYQFDFDAVWARILFIVLSLGLVDHGIGGFFILLYVICWMVFPARTDLEPKNNIKKFYRIPENKVLGGVAAGLSQYLKLDIVIIRLIFVFLGFAGVGILIYIIFWMVAPNALTLTQKMELKGQAVTIENIESSIKSNRLTYPKTESSLATILLFPFRMIGILLQALSNLITPIGSIVRIFAGILLFIIGAIFTVFTLIFTGAYFGVIQDSPWLHGFDIASIFIADLPPIGGLFAFLVLFAPSIAIVIAGFSLILNHKYGQRNFWLTMLAIWFAGLVGLSVLASKYSMNFKKQASFKEEVILSTPKSQLFIDAENKDGNDFNIYSENVRLATATSDKITLETVYSSRGKTEEIALNNARKISYNVIQKDSTLLFPSNLTIKGKDVPRNQKVEATLYIPKGKKFKLSANFARQLLNDPWQLSNNLGFDLDDIAKYTLIMGTDNKVECADCPHLSEAEREALRNRNYNFDDENKFTNRGPAHKQFEVAQFDKVEIGNNFTVEIRQGNTQNVEIFTDLNEDLNELKVKVSNGELNIDFVDPFKEHHENWNVVLTMPSIQSVDFSGAITSKIIGFDNLKELNVDLSGASKLALGVNVNHLTVDLTGASNLIGKGNVYELILDLSGSSEFNGKKMKILKATVEASGSSKANFSKGTILKSEKTGNSDVTQD